MSGVRVAGRFKKASLKLKLISSILCVVVVCSVAVAGVKAAHNSSGSRQTANVGAAQFLVLMVLDGARPDYFGLTPLPHVDELRRQGVQYSYAMDGILETETPSGHTTISTGSTPRRNGILGFSWADHERDYSLFSPDVVRSGAMERIMSEAHVPTIAGLFKAKHPREKVVALSGHKYYAADPLGGPKADAILYYRGDQSSGYSPTSIPGHVPPPGVLTAPGLSLPTFHLKDGQDDYLATSLAIAAFRKMYAHVLMINYPEFDWPLGHVYGGNLNRAKAILLMKTFDYDLGRIEDAYRKKGILDKTVFVITSDHGMGPVNRFIPSTLITDAVAHAGAKAPSIAYNGGAYVWLSDRNKAPAVAQNILAKRDPGIQSVYYLTGSGTSLHYVRAGGTFVSPAVDAANRYLLATLMNVHAPTVVALCKANATTSSSSTGWKADHGGASWPSQNIPLILSGAGVRQGIVTGEPAQLDDVAPTVLRLLGVEPVGMEGQVLAEALVKPNPADWKPRVAEANQITPLIQSLVSQAQYEYSHK